jgi:O-antigen ligase
MKLNKLINYLTFFFILIAYSYVATYFATFNNALVNPKNLFFLLFLYTLVMISFNSKNLSILKLPIFYWIIFYLSLILLYFIVNNHLDVLELRKEIFALVFFLCLVIIMSYDEDLTLTKKAILIATLIAIFNNIYEFFNPFVFYSEGSELKIIGRSAGFYVNTNIAGEAIVLGLLLSFSVVSKKFKYIFLSICFLGILVTFSRTAIFGFFLVVFFFMKNNEINRTFGLTVVLTLGISIVLLFPFLEDFLQTFFGSDAQNLINRLNFFTGSNTVDFSQKERTQVALSAFNLFADNLPFGAGLGVTEHWQYRVGAHNMYLTFMAEFGFIGIFLYPGLILSASYKAYKINHPLSKPFILYMLIIGFTTHNVLDAYHLLIALAFLSNSKFIKKEN